MRYHRPSTGHTHRPRRGGFTAVALATLAALASTLAVTALVATPAGAAPVEFSNTGAITIPGTGDGDLVVSVPASPYPSPIAVSGLSGTVQDVDVTLNGFTHAIPADVELMLVGPGGQSVVLMTDAGGNNPASNVTFTIDDQATNPIANPIVNGASYKPFDRDTDGVTDTWPGAPAPGGSALSAFNGTAPNGTWNLYVVDDADGDLGSIAGGWKITIDSGSAALPGTLQFSSPTYTGAEGASPATVTVNRVGGSDGAVSATVSTVPGGTATSGTDHSAVAQQVNFADGQTSRTVSIAITDDPDPEGIDETVNLSLTAPTGGATLGSPTSAVLRIGDNDAEANAFPITIPGVGTGSIVGAPADPYPSNIVVAGNSGVVTDVNVTVDNLSHTTPNDVGLLLVAPNGASTLLMSDAGSNANPVSNIDLTFDDEAAGSLPASGPITGGTFKPSDDDLEDDGSDPFPAPAPGGPAATLAALDGTSPNGTWSLYVIDDAAADVGSISGGWSLDLTMATADAGGPYTAPEGTAVTLSGSTSPDIPGATYEWDVDGDLSFDDATGANPTVSASTLSAIGLGDGPDSSSPRVRVTSGAAVVTSATATLTITNVAPTATLGNDGPVNQGNGATVTFTGQTDVLLDNAAGYRYSYDLDDDGDWEIGDGTYAGGSTSASAAVPAGNLATVGPHDVNARIIDKDGGFTDRTTVITVDPPLNAAAQADAGDDQTVQGGATVTLDGTGSSDANSDPFTYSWTQTGGTPLVTLTGATTAQPTFTAPAGPATLTFTLTVDDDGAGPHTSTDTVVITVNGAPAADAGPDQTVNETATVTLDGTGSSDPDVADTLTYSWAQTGGTPTVTLDGATTAQPTFTAPAGPATLTFTLTVSDGKGGSDTDTVVITVNRVPTADAGDDQLVNPATTVTLDGRDSSDPDSDTLTYSWAQTGGTPTVTLDGATTAQPTFTAPASGTLTFTLTVNDGRGGTDTDTVTVTVNTAPTADAGDDQLAQAGATVTLDGRDSSDPDTGDSLTYSWAQTGGTPTVTLDGATTAQPTFTAPASGTLTFTLTVTDEGGLTDTDTVVVTVNGAPVADAGPNQTADTGDTVTLDGTASADPDSDTLTYDWAQDSGTPVTLVGSNTANPSFTAPAGPTDLVFTLTVSDGRGGSDTDSVIVMVNGPAVADAGDDQDVDPGATVTLDGTGSSDPDGDSFTYAWAQTGGTPTVTLTGATTAQPTFTAPAGPATLTFTLTVDDDGAGPHTSTDTVVITVNGEPTADAGPDQTVNQGATATLDGTGSSDPDVTDTLTYAWAQTGGTPTVTLDGATTAQPTFTAPAGPATLTFTLTVSDGRGGSDTDTVTVTVNREPTADAGDDQLVNPATTVTLDGRDSSDPDGDTLTYTWNQSGGPALTLDGATTAQPTFTAPAAGTFTFTLTVTDGRGGSDTDTVTVAVNQAPTADAGDDQIAQAGTTVTLDGRNSTDPDTGDSLTYAWDQTGGTPTVILLQPDTAQPTFTAPAGPATLVFTLTVTDEMGRTDTDTVTVVVNRQPTADAGTDQLVNLGDTVTLNGTGSSDPDSDPLTYDWVQDSGTPVTLVAVDTAQPSFTAPEGPATLVFLLTVDDGKGGTDTDTVTVVVNGPPAADAGDDQVATEGTTVTLDGRDSSDPDSDTLTYDWIQTGGTPTVDLTGATTAQPTFTAPTGPATLVFELTVTDGRGREDSDTVTVTINRKPLANAGGDQLVNASDTVTLDGTASSDPESDPLTHSWAQTGGTPTVDLTGAATAQPTFTAPEGPTTLTFTLTVSDGRGGTATDTVAIRVNGRPDADAGPDQTVSPATTVTLNGTGSSDPDSGDTLTYSWVQDSGAAVTIVGSNTAQPTFTAPTGPATLVFILTVQDGQGREDTDAVTIRVNAIPDANAGPDQTVNGGGTVTLNGTGSSDADSGDTLTYSWAQTGGTPNVTLTGATTAQPTFTAPTGPTTLTFTLTVSDGNGGSDTDTVVITVNGLPSADAGVDQEVNLGDTVTLTGTASSDPDSDTLGYSWAQTGGDPTVDLTGATTAQPTFTAPEGPATLTFTLTVSDGKGGSDTDTVVITVNGPPTADAGDDETVVELTEVTLDGTGSSDPDSDTLTYSWVQTGTPTVMLSDADTAEPTFTAPAAPGTLTFELTVDDGAGRTDTDTVTITLEPRFTPDEAYTNHTYEGLLGRPGDPAGIAYWNGRLEDGVSRLTVARLIALSAEGTAHTVNQRYLAWLGRPVDASARTYWVGQLQDGRPLVDLELSVLGSNELYTRAGGTDSRYVTELFELLLGRAPDSAALAFYQGRLAAGHSRQSVASSILSSAECERRRVRDVYQRILGRAPTPDELNLDVGVLDITRDLRRVEIRVASLWENQPGSST